MLIRLLALCLMIVFAVPAMAHPCAGSLQPAPGAGTVDCHEMADSRAGHDAISHDAISHDAASHHADLCKCAMHQSWFAPLMQGDRGIALLIAPLRGGMTAPVLHGMAILPLSPPPNPLVS